MRLNASRLSAGFNSPTGSHRVRIFVRQYHERRDRRGSNVAGRRISDALKNRIVQMRQDGYGYKEIALRFQIGITTVSRACTSSKTAQPLKGA